MLLGVRVDVPQTSMVRASPRGGGGVDVCVVAPPEIAYNPGACDASVRLEDGAVRRLMAVVQAHFDLPLLQRFDLCYATGGGTMRVVRTDRQLRTFVHLVDLKRLPRRNGLATLRLACEPALLTEAQLYASRHVASEAVLRVPCRLASDGAGGGGGGGLRHVLVPCRVLDAAVKGEDADGRCFELLRLALSCVFAPVDSASFVDAEGAVVDVDDQDSACVYAAHVLAAGGGGAESFEELVMKNGAVEQLLVTSLLR